MAISQDNCSMAETILVDIPPPIITDILARLPPKEVLRCRCVCKAWFKLISEPEFVNLQLSKSPASLIVHKVNPKSPHSASFTLLEDETDHQGVRRIAGTDREIPRSSKYTGISMVGSIDGLVCCVNEYASEYELIHLWNPIMGEFITLQTPEGKRKYPNLTTYGFGTSSGKYHMVRIFQEIEITDYTIYRERIRVSTCHVYTIGDGVWKNIGQVPYMFGRGEHGLFFNGSLHWFIHDQDDGSEQICCLDLEKEVFKPFPPPLELCQGHIASLNLYKGCLSVCDNASDLDIVIWVMKEYGVQSSWSKEVVISKNTINLQRHYFEVVRIIKVFEDGEIWLLWRDKMVFSYHPKLKIVQDMNAEESMTGPNNNPLGLHPSIETTQYVSSIVSLKSLGEVNVRRY